MQLTDKEIRLLARLSRHRTAACMLSARVPISTQCKSLAYCNGWTRVRRLRRLNKIRVHPEKLHGISGRVYYAWVAAVENWRELVWPEVSVEVDAIDKIVWDRSSTSGQSTADK